MENKSLALKKMKSVGENITSVKDTFLIQTENANLVEPRDFYLLATVARIVPSSLC
jgi:hypothetical protein